MTARDPAGVAIGLTALTGLAFGARFRLLAEHPEATGMDGYYYVVQVRDAVATGALHVPDGSWVLWALAAVHGVVPDPVLAVKIGAAALAAACVPAGWFAGRALGGPVAAWAVALWAVASPTLTHLAADFPKNLGMAAPWLVVVAAVAAGRRWWWLAAGAALACATAHRTGAALLLLGALGAVVAAVAARVRIDRRVAAAGAGVAALFAVATAVVPALLHPADLDRLGGTLRAVPWPPGPLVWASLRTTSPVEIAAWLMPWPVLGIAAWTAWRWPARRGPILALGVPLAVLVSPWWSADTLDLGYRLGLLAPLVAAPLLAACLPPSAVPGPEIGRRAVFFVALAAPFVAWQGWSPAADPPYDRWRGVVAAIPRPLPDLVIAHGGMNFLIDHLTGAEALGWAPEPGLDRRRIQRVTWGVRDAEWAAAGTIGVVRLDTHHHYIREDRWEAFREWALDTGDPDLRARVTDPRNPARVRPASMRRNR